MSEVMIDLGVVSLVDSLDGLGDREPTELSPSAYLEIGLDEALLPSYHTTDHGWDAWIAEHLGPLAVKFLHPDAKSVRLTIEDLEPDENAQAGRSAELEVTPLPVRVIQCAS